MLSNKAKSEMLKMETRAKFPYLIEIQAANGNIYRYANTDEDVTFDENVYSACFFTITPPSIEESSIGNGTISFSSIDQLAINIIRSQSEHLKIRFVGAIVYNNKADIETIEAVEDSEFKLSNVTWDELKVSGTLVFDDWMDIKIPCDVSNSQNCPALV